VRELVELISEKSVLADKQSVSVVWFVVFTSLHVVSTVGSRGFVEPTVVAT